MNGRVLLCSLVLLVGVSATFAAEVVVSTRGDDAAAGTTQAPLATLQAGFNRLGPGDTLVIEPGVYRQRIVIDKVEGTPEKPVTIRARIPGTVFLLGSVTLDGWTKAPGTRHTWYTTLEHETTLVYQRDTNHEYTEMADPYQVDQLAGSFMTDPARKRIYVHTADDASPNRHLIEACVLPIGIDAWSGGPANWWISLRKHLVVEGLVLAGFSQAGLHVMRGDGCHVRRCVAHHCGAGLFMHSSIRSSIVECRASYCYDRNDNEGGAIAFRGVTLDNLIDRCTVHDVVKYGIRHYGSGMHGSAIRNCVVWRIGRVGIHTKGLYDPARRRAEKFTPPPSTHPMTVEHNVFVEPLRDDTQAFNAWGMQFNTVGAPRVEYRAGQHHKRQTQLVFKPGEADRLKFASPTWHDYRLQSDSPARGKGAYPEPGGVRFVRPGGNDEATGTSLASAWADVSRSIERLEPGQTLYVAGGTYAVSAKVKLEDDTPVTVARQSDEAVVFTGDGSPMIDVVSGALRLKGIVMKHGRGSALRSGVGTRVVVHRCVFDGSGTAVPAGGQTRITKSVFHDNTTAVACGPNARAVVYGCVFSDVETAYRGPATASEFNLFGHGRVSSVASLAALRRQTGQDTTSLVEANPLVDPDQGDYRLKPDSRGHGRGYLWSPTGTEPTPSHLFEASGEPTFVDVRTRLVTPTTANITWRSTGGRTTALLRWGTDAQKLDRLVDRRTGMHLDNVHTLTLFDLQPGTTYHYQVGTAPHRRQFGSHVAEPEDPSPPRWDKTVYRFTTPADWTPPRRTVYVSKANGDDASDGLAPERAFASLHKASEEALPGDRVVIAGGTYFGLLRPVNSGLPEAPITFDAAPGETVILSGKRLTQSRSVLLLDKAHIRLRGLRFKEHGKMLPGDVGSGGQIMIDHCRDVTVEDCLFDGRMYYMASVWCSFSRDVIFRDNVFYIWSNWTGIVLGQNPGRVTFEHNTLYTGATSLGYIAANDEVIFRNNIFGEKMRRKWQVPKFVMADNRKLTFDYNYWAFHPDNTRRSAMKVRPPSGEAYLESAGKDPLQRARELGLEEHGTVGPLPWKHADRIEGKDHAVRGVAPRDQRYDELQMDDFRLKDEGPWIGAAGDGSNPGRRGGGPLEQD